MARLGPAEPRLSGTSANPGSSNAAGVEVVQRRHVQQVGTPAVRQDTLPGSKWLYGNNFNPGGFSPPKGGGTGLPGCPPGGRRFHELRRRDPGAKPARRTCPPTLWLGPETQHTAEGAHA